MPAKKLMLCLVGSILLHITLFVVVVTKMPMPEHVTTHTVETFIIESPVAPFAEAQQSAPPRSGTITHTNSPKIGPIQQVHPGGGPSIPRAEQTPEIKAPQPVAQPGLAVLSPTGSTVQNLTPISLLSTPSQEENHESKTSISSRHDFESEQVMVLGGAGSPRFIHKEAPIYPFMARKLGKEGNVTLRLSLNDQGQLQKIDAVEAHGFGFIEAASRAIKKSTFAPAVKNGKAISSQVLVSVRFVLQGN